jgi:hypothetical protein
LINILEGVSDGAGDDVCVDVFIDYDGDQVGGPLDDMVYLTKTKLKPARVVLISGDAEWIEHD